MTRWKKLAVAVIAIGMYLLGYNLGYIDGVTDTKQLYDSSHFS